jgi:hypothetical protein
VFCGTLSDLQGCCDIACRVHFIRLIRRPFAGTILLQGEPEKGCFISRMTHYCKKQGGVLRGKMLLAVGA